MARPLLMEMARPAAPESHAFARNGFDRALRLR
jgi:hypothetical protein